MESIDVQALIFEFIGGLAIFLLGIKNLGDGLQKAAGDRLREILERFTSNPIMGVFAGMITTALIQSSSGTTVLTVALVNAGFMTLRQAIGVIMGANIGTTITSFIIGFNISDYGLPILALGALMLFFFKNQRLVVIGQSLFGFGSLFFGLKLMSGAMSPLRDVQFFHELTVSMSNNPILGVIIGTIFTMIVQSSSATVGILQGLHAEGAISLEAAIPVLFGDNIGTTITAIIASLGLSVAAKRAALTHTMFNVLGTVIFLAILPLFLTYLEYIQALVNLDPKMTIAFAHGSFNAANTIVQLPFVGVLAWLVTKLVPGEDEIIEYKPIHLDPLFIERSPTVAISQAKAEIVRMGEYSVRGLEETCQFLMTNDRKHAEKARQIEGALNNLDREITNYLVSLAGRSLTEQDSKQHTSLMDSVRDIERIGDHFENIIELIEFKITNKIELSDQAHEDVQEMFDLTISTVKQAIESLQEMNREKALEVLQREEQIDKMERKFRRDHIMRMNEGTCTGSAGVVFVDIISNLERIGDHAVNISEEVLENFN